MRFSFCKLVGGTACNVIPESVEIEGTLRTFDERDQEYVVEKTKELLKTVCEENDCQWVWEDHGNNAAAVINNPECAQFVRKVASGHYGEDKVTDNGLPVYASEDFSDFLHVKPGAFFFRANKNVKEGSRLHHNEYNFDDNVLEDVSEFWWKIVKERCDMK